jgi:hypothetical protein
MGEGAIFENHPTEVVPIQTKSAFADYFSQRRLASSVCGRL